MLMDTIGTKIACLGSYTSQSEFIAFTFQTKTRGCFCWQVTDQAHSEKRQKVKGNAWVIFNDNYLMIKIVRLSIVIYKTIFKC